MEFAIEETGTLTHCLTVEVSAEDLEPDINRAVRKHRAQLQMKGFRTGRVPMNLVKRLHGQELAQEAVRGLLEEMYEDLVLNSGKYNVWAESEQYNYDYDYGKDLSARITFAERPAIELQDFDGQVIEVSEERMTEEYVEGALEDILWNYGELQPVSEGADIEEGDILTYDLQEIDSELRAPILGTARKDQELVLSEEVNPLEEALREAALGAQVGSVVRFEAAWDDTGVVQDVVGHHSYEASITAVQRWKAAELTDELVRRVPGLEGQSVDTFRDWVAVIAEAKLERQNEAILREGMIDRLLEMHEFEVPKLVMDLSMKTLVMQWMALYGLKWMTGRAFYGMRRRFAPTVERQTRWLVLRDALLDKYGLDLYTVDVKRDLTEIAHDIMIKCMYTNTEPEELLENGYPDQTSVEFRVLTNRLFERLADSFLVRSDDFAPPVEAEPKLLGE